MRFISFILIIVLLLSGNIFSQNFYFPKSSYADSVALSLSMPGLAQQVAAAYQNPNTEDYYDILFRLQMVAADYQSALNTLGKIREVYGKEKWEGNLAIGIQFESYCLTKEEQKKGNLTFEELFPETLNKLYNGLPDEAKIYTNTFFNSNASAFKNNLDNIFKDLESAGNDSIPIQKAVEICNQYNSYLVYANVKSIAMAYLLREDEKKYLIEDSVLIKLTGGAEISAIVVRDKQSDLSKPVILRFDIYAGRGEMSAAKYIVSNGYTAVIAFVRGKYLSSNEIEPFEHDAEDTYEVIDWISKQPWCDGRVGMYGGSYLGFSQWSAVKKLHPALKTIVPQVSVGIGIDFPSQNGVFMTYMLRWIHYVTNNKLIDAAEFQNWQRWDDLYKEWYISGKSFRALDSLDQRPDKTFQKWLSHPSFDDYWQSMTPNDEEFAKIDIPVLTTTGYYDADQRGAFYYFKKHYSSNKNAEHYLLIGPYNHPSAASYAYSFLSGYYIDPVASISISRIVFQWFDYIFYAKHRPEILKDKINYQVMGKNVWKHSPKYDMMNNDTLVFHLTTQKQRDMYRLTEAKPPDESYVKQEIDFNNRSDTSESKYYFNPMVIDSIFYTGEALKFVSEPLKDSIEINGEFTGDVILSINKKDIDLYIELYELMPDGRYFFLSNYVTRASYTKNRSERHLLTPGKWETIPINNSYFTSRLVPKGSRILIMMGICKSRDWQVNYGTGKDVSDETIEDGKIPLKIKWNCATSIKLPVYRYK